MMAQALRYAFISWLAVTCGCALFQPTGTRTPAGQAVDTTPAAYIQRARDLEKRSELRQALLAWRVAAALDNESPAVATAIADLETRIDQATKLQFDKGMAYYQAGKLEDARMAFLQTIHLNPDHRGARYYLKIRLHSTNQTVYRVKRGDSYSKIAADTYKDARKAYLIAYFNNRNPHKPLLTGTILLLPALDPHFLDPRKEINDWVTRARIALEQGDYDDVLDLTALIDKAAPGHSESRKLRDEAYYQQGLDLIEQQRYLEALETLKKVGKRHKKRNTAIRKARQHIQTRALNEKLKDAQRYLKQKKYSSVIHVTEQVLKQSPKNAKAKELFNAANYAMGKQLLDHGEEAAAAQYLGVVDNSYQDTRQLLSLALARMRAQAETHYRNGVKHFINEDLEKAVKAWERALELNPKHPKARQDIENARRLLKKWKAIEKEETTSPESQ